MERMALAHIKVENPEFDHMTIYYNGDGEHLTAEHGDYVEDTDVTARNLTNAIRIIHDIWGYGWELEWI